MNPIPPKATRVLDSHLILNGLGRVAAQFYVATQKESDELYALSDYLSLGLRLTALPTVPLSDEARLLELYVGLLRSTKYSGLQLDLKIQDVAQVALPTHSSCDALALMLQAARPDAKLPLRMAARFSEDGVLLQAQERVARLHKGLQEQCPGWRMNAADGSGLSLQWTRGEPQAQASAS